MLAQKRLIVALDTNEVSRARQWAAAVSPHAGLLKIGLEYFLANGHAGVEVLSEIPLFLDLKLHDIPNTVSGAVRAILPLKPAMLTVHACGGAAMIRAAHQAAASAASDRPMILAVTVLTSLGQEELDLVGVAATPAEQVLRLGRLAIEAGADGLVCSPLEVAMLRQAFGASVKLVVPGIRPAGLPADDQARTMTPAMAARAGADWIVVGRPVTAASDPGAAAAAIAAEL